jgi:maltooligosyltrehalose synthase
VTPRRFTMSTLNLNNKMEKTRWYTASKLLAYGFFFTHNSMIGILIRFSSCFQLTMKGLLSWVRTNLIKERPEMFMKGDTV